MIRLDIRANHQGENGGETKLISKNTRQNPEKTPAFYILRTRHRGQRGVYRTSRVGLKHLLKRKMKCYYTQLSRSAKSRRESEIEKVPVLGCGGEAWHYRGPFEGAKGGIHSYQSFPECGGGIEKGLRGRVAQ